MNIAIIGARGGIGSALLNGYSSVPANRVYALSRNGHGIGGNNLEHLAIDFDDESTLADAARHCMASGPVDIVINAIGILHAEKLAPEKSIQQVSRDSLTTYFHVNATCAALALKHFLPVLPRKDRGIFASLSARVGSISDNRLGGWYGYRASKAAHNMLIKTAAIELARTRREAAVVGIHPGTVDTALSKPFTRNLSANVLFEPSQACMQIMALIDRIGPEHSGKVLAYDGSEVPP